jgi:glycosyltransferase involved in cell wall biosynthesis
MRRLIAYVHGVRNPAARFRIGQYRPLLEQAGWQVSMRPQRPERPWDIDMGHPLVNGPVRRGATWARRVLRRRDIDDAGRYDCVFQNRDLLEGRFEYEERLLSRNARLLFDFDDAIYLGTKAAHIGRICARAAWVVVGNEALAAFARLHTSRVTVIPTVVDHRLYPPPPPVTDRRARPVRVGWLGSPLSIEQTLFPFLPMLAELQHLLRFEFVVMTTPTPRLPPGNLHWQFVAWTPYEETQIASHIDIGIMPLVDTPYQRGKCGCKLLQYMAAGLPVVASPVGINAALVGDGARGLTAGTRDEWKDALGTLIRDPALRHTMGMSGRAFVRDQYSVQRWFPTLLDVIQQVSRQNR